MFIYRAKPAAIPQKRQPDRLRVGAAIQFVSLLRLFAGRIACLAVLLAAVNFPLADGAVFAAQSPTEYQVKAAYLFNFLKFVEWPDDPAAEPHGKWVIGFVGDTPIGDELTQLVEGKNVLGRDLQVKKFQAVGQSARLQHFIYQRIGKEAPAAHPRGLARIQRSDGGGHGQFYRIGRNDPVCCWRMPACEWPLMWAPPAARG